MPFQPIFFYHCSELSYTCCVGFEQIKGHPGCLAGETRFGHVYLCISIPVAPYVCYLRPVVGGVPVRGVNVIKYYIPVWTL